MQSIKEYGVRIIGFIADFYQRTYFKFILIALVLLLILFIYLYTRNRHKNKVIKTILDLSDNLAKCIKYDKELDKNLYDILSLISPIISAKECSFYLYDSKNNHYLLKAVLHMDEHYGKINPSYSGLLPYEKDTYLPPLSLPVKNIREGTAIIREGNVHILNIPIKDKGVIHIGPIAKVSSRQKFILDNFSIKLEPILDMLLETERLKNQAKKLISSSRTIKKTSNFIIDYSSMLNIIISMSIKIIGANGGLFLRKEGREYKLIVCVGLDKEAEDMFNKDREVHCFLNELAADSNYLVLNKKDKAFFKIPSYLIAEGLETICLVNIPSEGSNGTAVFWYKEECNDNIDIMEKHRVAALMMMTNRIEDILNIQSKYREISDSYIVMMKALAQTVDGLSPYTAGYSELMSRYAKIIAQQMGLSKQEVDSIALAAYLSNIGVLGFSTDILLKEGRYSEIEYEMMKLHSDTGAAIIEVVLGNNKLAKYIKYHHERVDGLGYPERLKADEIPEGARIIAVVQTFLAMIYGRKSREPLPFDQALEALKSVSGTQLDNEIVEILINWFKKKQEEMIEEKYSLGPCWQMKCSPQSICSGCPAYMHLERNCWEYESNNCLNHGSKCDTCYVYTEMFSRNKSIVQLSKGEINSA